MKSLFLILCGFSFCLSAATVDTNQSAILINADEAAGSEQIMRALTAVISKKSGLNAAQISSQYNIDESFKTAVVRSYREGVPDQIEGRKQWFNVTVSQEEMQQLMLAQRIPIWPERRGEVFVWVVEEIENQPLVHASSDSESVYWLKKWFDVMGLPSQFYDPSAEDLLSFKPQDVRYLNPDLFDYLQAEKEISLVLLVFVKHSSNGYSYRFGLAEIDQPTVIKNLQFLDLSMGMNALVGFVQEFMAEDQRLYAEEFNNNTVAVSINDISDANSVLKLLNYLDQHALIDEYQVNQMKARKMNLMMRIKVLPETFIGFVENEGFLRHQPLDIGRTILFKWVQ